MVLAIDRFSLVKFKPSHSGMFIYKVILLSEFEMVVGSFLSVDKIFNVLFTPEEVLPVQYLEILTVILLVSIDHLDVIVEIVKLLGA